MAKQTVSDDIKTAALRDLSDGAQPASVAERYGVNRATVKQWIQRLSPDVSPAPPALSPPAPEQTTRQKQRPQTANQIGEPIYYLRRGMPRNGPDGSLAGVAEPGARLEVSGENGGSFVNRGTLDAPRWERMYAANPTGTEPAWWRRLMAGGSEP